LLLLLLMLLLVGDVLLTLSLLVRRCRPELRLEVGRQQLCERSRIEMDLVPVRVSRRDMLLQMGQYRLLHRP
jgi:hypothetical protein